MRIMTVKHLLILTMTTFCLSGLAAENTQKTLTQQEAATPKLNIVKVIDFTKTKKTAALQEAKVNNLLSEKKPVQKIDFTKNTRAVSKNTTSKSAKKGYSYTVRGKRYQTLADSNGFVQQGAASWYGNPFHGRKTASGEIYNMNEMTAAHKELPLGTKVEVTNLANGRKVIVRVNDRGPFHSNRVLDLSRAAAKKLGTLNSGVAQVRIRALH